MPIFPCVRSQNDYYVLICIIEALNFAWTIFRFVLVCFALLFFDNRLVFQFSFVLSFLLPFPSSATHIYECVLMLRFSCNLENYSICRCMCFLLFSEQTNQSQSCTWWRFESFDRLIAVAIALTQKKSHLGYLRFDRIFSHFAPFAIFEWM